MIRSALAFWFHCFWLPPGRNTNGKSKNVSQCALDSCRQGSSELKVGGREGRWKTQPSVNIFKVTLRRDIYILRAFGKLSLTAHFTEDSF